MRLLKQAAVLLHLVNQKRQHHQVSEHLLVAVTEVMLKVVAVVLQGVKRLINLPAGPRPAHQPHQVGLMQGNIRHPGKVLQRCSS